MVNRVDVENWGENWTFWCGGLDGPIYIHKVFRIIIVSIVILVAVGMALTSVGRVGELAPEHMKCKHDDVCFDDGLNHWYCTDCSEVFETWEDYVRYLQHQGRATRQATCQHKIVKWDEKTHVDKCVFCFKVIPAETKNRVQRELLIRSLEHLARAWCNAKRKFPNVG